MLTNGGFHRRGDPIVLGGSELTVVEMAEEPVERTEVRTTAVLTAMPPMRVTVGSHRDRGINGTHWGGRKPRRFSHSNSGDREVA